MNEPYLNFKKSWENVLAKKPYPHFLRNIIRIKAEDFIKKIAEANQKTADEIVDSIISGDCYVLKGGHTEEEVIALRKRIIEWREKIPPAQSEKIIEGCPDYHKINNVEREGKDFYKTLDHPHGFFRWNGDSIGIFKMIDKYWDAVKILSGFPPHSFKKSTPKDGVIDKLTIFQYPMGFGRITKHYDPPENQKVLLNLPLTQMGQNYGYESGFYVVDKDTGKNFFVERLMDLGDYVCVSPTLHHGAQPPKLAHEEIKSPEWNTEKGRWLLAAISVPSHHVQERKSTVAVND